MSWSERRVEIVAVETSGLELGCGHVEVADVLQVEHVVAVRDRVRHVEAGVPEPTSCTSYSWPVQRSWRRCLPYVDIRSTARRSRDLRNWRPSRYCTSWRNADERCTPIASSWPLWVTCLGRYRLRAIRQLRSVGAERESLDEVDLGFLAGLDGAVVDVVERLVDEPGGERREDRDVSRVSEGCPRGMGIGGHGNLVVAGDRRTAGVNRPSCTRRRPSNSRATCQACGRTRPVGSGTETFMCVNPPSLVVARRSGTP